MMELIIINGKIVTMDQLNPRAEAIAIAKGKIIKVGNTEEILTLKKEKTTVLDLGGKLLLPGFNDSHMHLLNYGLSLHMVNLEGSSSIDEIIDRVENFIDKNNIPAGEWVRGLKWNHNLFPNKSLPTRFDLDKISQEHPIFLYRICGHGIVANSKALEVAGIDKKTPQINGGHFDIDDDGNPLGIFRENAIQLIFKHIPKPNTKEIKNIIKTAAEDVLKYGITSVQSDDLIAFPDSIDQILNAYNELNKEGNLPIRVNQQSNLTNIETLRSFLNKGLRTGVGDEYFKIGPLKLLVDGSLGARTAYLNEPYSDDPSTSGISIYTQDELDELVIYAHKSGMQIAIHAIGDKAMDMTFNSFAKAHKLQPNLNARHSIVHCQITDEALLDKFKELNIIAHIQPQFVSSDLHIVEQKIGEERAKTSYNWKSLLDREVNIACGSDCPVESPNVLHGIYAAVTRKDLNGFPENGWLEEQKLTVDQVVPCYTSGSAYTSFDEDVKGSIIEGKLADMVVLSDDIYEIDPNKIKDVEVLMTFVGGKLVEINI